MTAVLPRARNSDARPAIEPVPSPSGRRWLVRRIRSELRSLSHARAIATSTSGTSIGAVTRRPLLTGLLGLWLGFSRNPSHRARLLLVLADDRRELGADI